MGRSHLVFQYSTSQEDGLLSCSENSTRSCVFSLHNVFQGQIHFSTRAFRDTPHAEQNVVREEQCTVFMPFSTTPQMFSSIVQKHCLQRSLDLETGSHQCHAKLASPNLFFTACMTMMGGPQSHALGEIDTAAAVTDDTTRLAPTQPFCFKISLSPSDSAIPCVFDLQITQPV